MIGSAAVLPSVTSGTVLAFTLAPLGEDYGIPLALMGMFVVFLSLVLVISFIACLPRFIELLEHVHPSRPVRPEKPHRSPPKSAPDEIPEEIVVVIAAAVAEAIGTRHRIVHMRPAASEDHGWSLEGRMRHHGSHQNR